MLQSAPNRVDGRAAFAFRQRAALIALVCFTGALAYGAGEPPLIFFGDKDYPPVAYLQNGVAKGMDVDLARALAGPMKREVRVELIDWNLAQEKILKGEADGLLGLSISDERRQLYDFAIPTFTREFGLAVRSGEMTIRGAGDLAGKTVGVTAGGFPRVFFEGQRGIHLVFITDYRDGLNQLAHGTLDAVAADMWVMAYVIERTGIHGVTILEKPFATAPGAIAVKKGNVALLNQINHAIISLGATGKIAGIQDDWRPQEMLFASRQRVHSIATLAAGALAAILFGVMGTWIITLRRQVRFRRQVESALKESEERYRHLTQASFEGVFITANGRILDVNDQGLKMFGYEREEFIGKKVIEVVAPASRAAVAEALREGRETIYGHELLRKDGSAFFAEAQAKHLEMGGLKLRMTALRDVTERRRAEGLSAAQRLVLEMIASGAPMLRTLETLVHTMESQSPEMLCSILLLEPDGVHLRHGAVSSLPADYVAAVDGSSIGPCAGSCGTAMFRREPVFVADIASDPLWADYRHLVQSHGLRACWSAPIFDAQRNILGTFAIYFRRPGLPDERHLRLIEMATHTAAICISRHRSEVEHAQAVQREQQVRISYTLQLIASQEAERKRIAAELHDSLGQNLLLIKNLAQMSLRDQDPAQTYERVAGISHLAGQCIAEARQISYDLHPPQLDHLGLARALEAMVEKAASASDIVFTRKFDSVEELFSAEAAMNFYRIAQESLNNILKYAHAKNVDIRLERDIAEVQLRITDDGCGFAVEKSDQGGKGMGLKNINERVRMLGGKLKIDSAPGRGARIEVTVPISEKSSA